MSGLRWALLLQAIYFGFWFITLQNEERKKLNDDPSKWLFDGVLGLNPSLPLLFTVLSLFLYPTAWAFIWLIANIAVFLYQGTVKKDGTLIISGIAGFIVLFINNSILNSISVPQWVLLLQITYFFGILLFTVENKHKKDNEIIEECNEISCSFLGIFFVSLCLFLYPNQDPAFSFWLIFLPFVGLVCGTVFFLILGEKEQRVELISISLIGFVVLFISLYISKYTLISDLVPLFFGLPIFFLQLTYIPWIPIVIGRWEKKDEQEKISFILIGFLLLINFLSLSACKKIEACIFLLAINTITLLVIGNIKKLKEFIIMGIIELVILLIALKWASIKSQPEMIPKPEIPKPIPIPTDTWWSSGWSTPVYILIALASVIGILVLSEWVLKKLRTRLNIKEVLDKVLFNVLVAVISGVIIAWLNWLFGNPIFGDPKTATVFGLLAAAGIYFFNQNS